MQNLRYGSIGPTVSFAQLGLLRAGYLPVEPDGIFGRLTQSAVLKFQRASGLRQDGVIGANTWKSLRPWLEGYLSYQVRRGDTFFRISERYGTSMLALETANPKADPLNLQIGQKLIVPLPFSVVPGNVPFTSLVLESCINGLHARYPYLGIGSIGKSVLGRPLHMLRLGVGENKVFVNGTHHANEWITTPVLMQYMENFAEAYMHGGEIGGIPAETLHGRSALHMVPMVNPDGADLVTGYITAGTDPFFNALMMNGSQEGFPQNWKANIRGVDLNLQYPADWELAKEIKFAQGYTQPGPRDYVGPEPLSEPESRAVYEYSRKQDFALTLSYHTQGKVIYWKYKDYEPFGSRRIGLEFSRLSGYALELTPDESANAGYRDWFILEYNRPGYTIEAGSGINPLPLTQFPEIYSNNEGILSYALFAAAGDQT